MKFSKSQQELHVIKVYQGKHCCAVRLHTTEKSPQIQINPPFRLLICHDGLVRFALLDFLSAKNFSDPKRRFDFDCHLLLFTTSIVPASGQTTTERTNMAVSDSGFENLEQGEHFIEARVVGSFTQRRFVCQSTQHKERHWGSSNCHFALKASQKIIGRKGAKHDLLQKRSWAFLS